MKMKSKYKLKKNHGAPLGMGDANDWMKRYKDKNPDGPWGFFFGENIVRKVIDHPEAVGMRVYLGLTKDNNLQVLLLGTREDGTNILPTEGKDGGGGTCADESKPCPPYC
jgi:hypothetical protein